MPDPATGFLASISLGYADNDVGIDTTTARTNPVDVWGSPESATAPLAGGIMYNHATTAATAVAVIDRFMGSLSQTLMKAAASQKYMYMKVFQNAAGLAVTLQCVEL
jgi:hypothetical protein